MKKHSGALASAVLALGIVAAPAQAASVSYFLDKSNDLSDGTNYLKVTISDGLAGAIDFTVETLSPLSSIAGSNYGIQDFGFNTTLAPGTITSGNFSGLVAGWSISVAPPTIAADGFGKFEFAVSNGGSNRLDPLTFSINVAGDSINSYYEASTGNAGQGNVQYAAHVAGFTTQSCTSGPCTSAWFGGGAPVPLPAAVWLFGSGLLGLIGVARRRRTA